MKAFFEVGPTGERDQEWSSIHVDEPDLVLREIRLAPCIAPEVWWRPEWL